MKRIASILVLFITVLGSAQEVQNKIKGMVTDGTSPIKNVSISVEGSKDAARMKTNHEGRYEVMAQPSDVLIFEYGGLQSIEIVVEDVTRILNIEMYPKVEELDEVVVKGSNRKSQKELQAEYATNKNLIKTAFGIIDKETAGGNVRFRYGNEINDVAICILDVVRNEFPGVRAVGNCSVGGFIVVRGANSITNDLRAIYDVDGQIFTDTPIWIAPAAIERIAVLNSLGLATRYGSIGAGGVIVINTKVDVKNASNKIFDKARLRNNLYQNDAIGSIVQKENLPKYLKELYASADIAVAKATYENNRLLYRNSPYYFVDSYAYFKSVGADKFAKKIFTDQQYLFEENPVYAKALAYQLDAHGEAESSKDVYENIFTIRPNYAQSYRDLANSYRLAGNYKKSASMYARYNYLLEEEFLKSDSVGIQPIIEREFDNLLALENDKLFEESKLIVRSDKYLDFEGTRLFFEWNDSEAEFELQFVNPEKHFYVYNHTQESNPQRIKDGKLMGYSSEEFLMDGSLPGTWQVNINYKGNKKLEPAYLKVTTYYNYGELSQKEKVEVFRLGLKNVNQKLFTIKNAGI